MKRFLPLILGLGLGLTSALFAEGVRFEAKNWRNLKTYDVATLSKNIDSHVGELVAVKFTFRGKPMHHLKANWYQGSIWMPDPKGKKGFSNVRVMVSKADLEKFQSITPDFTSSAEITVYGPVLHDADSDFAFIRVVGRTAAVDSSGNAVVSW